MSNGCVISVTDERFDDEVLRNPGTVLVDFYTAWCPPCRQVVPVLEELCSTSRGGLKIVKIDAVENAKTAAEHDVLAVPTFVLYHDGKKVGQFSGYRSKAQFEAWIAAAVDGAE